jgi:2-polyprenyl-3-methyl-5-hydroxy-6-metoxy-1,4-benzoquinol methylase
MRDMFNSGFLVLMVSIGHQTGLLKTMSNLDPSTSHQIADAANLNERYVREWLGAMVTGKLIDYKPEAGVYFFPPEHARVIGNFAIGSQYLPAAALVEAEIVHCFRHGGGVPYEKNPRILEIYGEGSRQWGGIFMDEILPLADMQDALETGCTVLDIGCGHGHKTIRMAQAYPNSKFVGYDISVSGITIAKKEATELRLHNVHFEAKDLVQLDDVAQYDLVVAYDVIHDQAQPRKVLQAAYNALQPQGTFFMVDFQASSHVHENMDHPSAPFLYGISLMHCMTVSLAQGGEGLGTVWGEQMALKLLAEAGFENMVIKHLEGDFMNNYYIARKE